MFRPARVSVPDHPGMWEKSRRKFRIVGDTLREFNASNDPFLSAGLAFYALLCCFPLLLLFVTALGYAVERSEVAMEATKSFVQTLFPASEPGVVGALESFSEHRHVLGLVTFAAFLLFGRFGEDVPATGGAPRARKPPESIPSRSRSRGSRSRPSCVPPRSTRVDGGFEDRRPRGNRCSGR